MKHRGRPQPSPLSAGCSPPGAMADLFEHFLQLIDAGYRLRMIGGYVRSGGRDGNSHARMHARVRRHHFEDDVIEHMTEAQHGELTATAACIKDFASLAKPGFAEMQILLRDELINQITGGESVAKSDLDVAFTGHSSRHSPHALLPVTVAIVYRRHI